MAYELYKFKKWKKSLGKYEKQYNILRVLDDTEVFQLLLESDDAEGERIVLDYANTGVCSYRNYEESFWVEPLNAFIREYGNEFLKYTFFEVLDSEYKKDISKWGFLGRFLPEEFFHLLILAGDSAFEIISHGEPTLRPYQEGDVSTIPI